MTDEAPEVLLSRAVWQAIRVYRVTCDDPLEFIEAIEMAARAYSASDSELLTAARRRVLHDSDKPARRRVRSET